MATTANSSTRFKNCATSPTSKTLTQTVKSSMLEHAGSEDIHGVGETLSPPVMAAIGNAVYNAVGARIRDLPLTAEKVLRELAFITSPGRMIFRCRR